MTGGAIAKTPVVRALPQSASLFQMDENSKNALFYCTLLALQFGLQPMIAKIFKILVAAFSVISGSGAGDWEKLKLSWSVADSLKVAALPAVLYAIQNVCVQYGYVLLDSMTFNLLNQTKTLSAAIWLYLLMDQKQSSVQIFALFLLLASAVLLNIGQNTSPSGESGNYQLGLIVVASASMISGLSAALTQRALVGNKSVRSPVFMSAELAVYGIFVLLLNLMLNNELGSATGSFLANWSVYTLVPVISNGLGGIIVGQVTKYAGSVVKGFALIAGIAITGVAQWLIDGKPLGPKDLAAIVLVSVAIYLHAKYPVPKAAPKPTEAKDSKEKQN